MIRLVTHLRVIAERHGAGNDQALAPQTQRGGVCACARVYVRVDVSVCVCRELGCVCVRASVRVDEFGYVGSRRCSVGTVLLN